MEFTGCEPDADHSITRWSKVISGKAGGNERDREHVANAGLSKVKEEMSIIKKRKKKNLKPKKPPRTSRIRPKLCIMQNFQKMHI